jgi:hypothetical protein
VQVRIVVSDFQPQGQPGLNQKLQQIVRDLAEIDKLRYQITVNIRKELVVKQISQFTDSLE